MRHHERWSNEVHILNAIKGEEERIKEVEEDTYDETPIKEPRKKILLDMFNGRVDNYKKLLKKIRGNSLTRWFK